MPKKKKKDDTYEGVRLYSDVSKKDVKQQKKQLLKQLSVAGNRGMERIARQHERGYRADEWDRSDPAVNMATTEATVRALDKERNRMMRGLDIARKRQGRAHSKAMDRMAARNIAYMDQMRHARKLSTDALKERIAAMKLAAEAAAAGGGGGGGGGGGSSYDPGLGLGGDDAVGEFMQGLAPELRMAQTGVQEPSSPVMNLATQEYNAMLAQGMTPEEAKMAVAETLANGQQVGAIAPDVNIAGVVDGLGGYGVQDPVGVLAPPGGYSDSSPGFRLSFGDPTVAYRARPDEPSRGAGPTYVPRANWSRPTPAPSGRSRVPASVTRSRPGQAVSDYIAARMRNSGGGSRGGVIE